MSVKLTTAHFEILADRTEPSLLRYIADALEAARPRITSDLEAPGPPQTHVRVWADRAGLYAELQAIQGYVREGVRGFTQPPDTFSLRADTGGADAVAECAVHEFTHLVSRSLNLDWPACVWLRETVSLYEAGQFRNPASFDYMRAGNYPTIAGLVNDIDRVEQVGYVLGQYIVETWGTHGLVLLIRASGDISAALGVSTQEFESGWYAFLHQKYGLPSR